MSRSKRPERKPPASGDQASKGKRVTRYQAQASRSRAGCKHTHPGQERTASARLSPGLLAANDPNAFFRAYSCACCKRSCVQLDAPKARIVHVEDLTAQVDFPESYRVGRLRFALPAVLEAGHRYRMVLGAYDNLDNGASAAREITISGSGAGGFALERVYNVPNPLDGGGTISLKTDAQGKVYSTALLRMEVPVPPAVARQARREAE